MTALRHGEYDPCLFTPSCCHRALSRVLVRIHPMLSRPFSFWPVCGSASDSFSMAFFSKFGQSSREIRSELVTVCLFVIAPRRPSSLGICQLLNVCLSLVRSARTLSQSEIFIEPSFPFGLPPRNMIAPRKRPSPAPNIFRVLLLPSDPPSNRSPPSCEFVRCPLACPLK